MRKLLLWLAMFGAFTIAQALPTDAIEIFIADGNSVSLSSAGKIRNLNISSGGVRYDISNRVTQVGNVTIAYDGVGRVVKIGEITVIYDQSSRIIKLGNTVIAYDFASRMSKIGDAVITYDVISRVTNVSGMIPDNYRLALTGQP